MSSDHMINLANIQYVVLNIGQTSQIHNDEIYENLVRLSVDWNTIPLFTIQKGYNTGKYIFTPIDLDDREIKSLMIGEYIKEDEDYEDDEHQYDKGEDDENKIETLDDFRSYVKFIREEFSKRYQVGSIPFVSGTISFKVNGFSGAGGLMSNIKLISNKKNIHDMVVLTDQFSHVDTIYVDFD